MATKNTFRALGKKFIDFKAVILNQAFSNKLSYFTYRRTTLKEQYNAPSLTKKWRVFVLTL